MHPWISDWKENNGPVMRGKDSAASGKGAENKVFAFELKPTAGLSALGNDMLQVPNLCCPLRNDTHSTLLANEREKK